MVLMYHNISAGRGKVAFREWQPAYDVAASEFQAHLELLAQWRRPAHLTFDDGYRSLLDWAEKLQQLRLAATCFVTTAAIGQAGMLHAAEIRALAQAGIHIGSHSHSHRFLEGLTPAALHDEILMPKKILEDLLGREVVSMSLPGGRYDRATLRFAAASGYRQIFTSIPGRPPKKNATPALVPRWVITAATSRQEFENIVCGEGWHVFKQRSRYFAGRFGKRFLGNDNYHRLWSKLHHLKTSSLAERDQP